MRRGGERSNGPRRFQSARRRTACGSTAGSTAACRAARLSHLDKDRAHGQVRVDGKRADISTRLEGGASARAAARSGGAAARRPPRQPRRPQAIGEMTLFEDRDVLVLNKPWGLAVQGGSGTKRHIDGMLAALVNEGERPLLVHRLDRDTSGVLLVAKSRKIAADLGAMFRSRGARKIYWAVVEGVPKPAQGRISLFLAKGEGMGDARAPRAARRGATPRKCASPDMAKRMRSIR